MCISSAARPALECGGDQEGLSTLCVALYETLRTEGICSGNGGKKAPLALLISFFGSPYLPFRKKHGSILMSFISGEKNVALLTRFGLNHRLGGDTKPTLVGYDEKCDR